NEEVVFDEVKIDGKGAASIGNGRGGQPTRGDIQRDMPPVVHKWTQLHSDLAYDLRPHVERLAGVLPCLIGERWPVLHMFFRLVLSVSLLLTRCVTIQV